MLYPQAAMILFLAPFDPLLSGRKMIYITMETPIANTKYSEWKPKYQIHKNSSFSFDQSFQMLLMCATSIWLKNNSPLCEITWIIKYVSKEEKKKKDRMAHKKVRYTVAAFPPLNRFRGKQLVLYFKTVIKHYLSSISVMHYSLSVAKRRL